jgi:hypothetical protein
VYLLRVEFATDAAPIAASYVGEVGTLDVTDPGELSNAASGALHLVKSSGASLYDTYVIAEFAGVAGRAVIAETTLDAATYRNIGWFQTLGLTIGQNCFELRGTSAGNLRDESGFVRVPLATSGSHRYVVVRRSGGGTFFFEDDALVWVGEVLNETANRYATLALFSPTADAAFDYIRVRDLPGVFATPYGLAAFTDTTLLSGDTFTGTADGIHNFEFTLPVSPSADDEVTLEYRRQDADNKWKAYLKRNVGNSAWDFNLDSIVAGTPTNRINVTGVSTPDTIRVIATGDLHDCYTKEGTTWTKRGGQINSSTHAAENGIALEAVSGTTLNRCTAWSRESSVYDELDRT